MDRSDEIIIGLSGKDVDFLCTCISFTKCWAKCFDNDESKKQCNELIDYLKFMKKTNCYDEEG